MPDISALSPAKQAFFKKRAKVIAEEEAEKTAKKKERQQHRLQARMPRNPFNADGATDEEVSAAGGGGEESRTPSGSSGDGEEAITATPSSFHGDLDLYCRLGGEGETTTADLSPPASNHPAVASSKGPIPEASGIAITAWKRAAYLARLPLKRKEAFALRHMTPEEVPPPFDAT